MINEEYDIIVIGAGVVGSSIAYHLTESKKNKVLLIDQGYPMSGTSGATHACVNVHSKTPSSYGEFSFLSSELYTYLEREIGDFEYKRTGSIHPFFSEEERDIALALQEEQAKVGIKVDVLTKDEVLAKVPESSSEVVGATFSNLDGHLNPFRLIELYLHAAKKKGLSTAYYHQVNDIQKTASGFEVKTDKAHFKTGKVVLAAGPWIKELGKLMQIDLPVKQVRGQLLGSLSNDVG